MHPAFNPKPNPLFCPEQCDFLTTTLVEVGFIAIELNLIEGFVAGKDEKDRSITTIHLTNNSQYASSEDVPTLVARYAAVKHLRYARDNQRGEVRVSGGAAAVLPAAETIQKAAPSEEPSVHSPAVSGDATVVSAPAKPNGVNWSYNK